LIDETIANIILVISGFGSGLYVGIASGTAGFILIPTLTIFLSYSIHKVHYQNQKLQVLYLQ
jgi:uncharacterized membrane protein YfcA